MSTNPSNTQHGASQIGETTPVWLDPAHCSIDEFRVVVEQDTHPATVPLARAVVSAIPIYDAEDIGQLDDNPDRQRAFMAEWNRVFASGAGAFVVRRTYRDAELLDAVTDVLNGIFAEEAKTHSAGGGDHFAPAGANSRLWNAHEKLCVANPELFARYNANPVVPLASRAWLGPAYQITSAVNVVHPGSKAQSCHRDYHMGFQDVDTLQKYPASVHRLSATLTLQGTIAHSAMPVESGPTKLLPFSQCYLPGYLATHQSSFHDYFEEHHVQLPLEKGDTMFFNPAVFHAAGENRTSDIQRFANLLQIGSGYGRSIEYVDRLRMSIALYPALRQLKQSAALDATELETVIAASAEGYPFPANLDIDSPLSGMAAALRDALCAQQARKRSH